MRTERNIQLDAPVDLIASLISTTWGAIGVPDTDSCSRCHYDRFYAGSNPRCAACHHPKKAGFVGTMKEHESIHDPPSQADLLERSHGITYLYGQLLQG